MNKKFKQKPKKLIQLKPLSWNRKKGKTQDEGKTSSCGCDLTKENKIKQEN